LLFSNSVVASSEIDVQFEFYDIFPRVKTDIKAQLQKNTPIIHKNTKYHGRTFWQIEWSIAWKKTNGICYINSNKTKLNVLFEMPRISASYSASDPVIVTFDKYYEALLMHENGHMNNGTKALKAIEMLLSNFKSYSDCQVLNKEVKNSIAQIISQYKSHDVAYDSQTEHGKLQGVLLSNFM